MSYKYNCLQQPYCQKPQQNCCPVVLAIAGQGVGGLGAAGARGLPGVGGILGYASYYFVTVPLQAVAANFAFSFPLESAVATGGISRTGLTTDTFTLANAGAYEFSWQMSNEEGPVQIAVRLNGVEMASTRVGKRTGTVQLVNDIILDVPAGSQVQLIVAQFSTNTFTAALQGSANPLSPNTGNFVIKRLS